MLQYYRDKLKSTEALKALAEVNGNKNTFYIDEVIALCEKVINDFEDFQN